MAASLEQAFLTLLKPSADAQAEGFDHIRNLLKAPDIDASLCECMTVSQDPAVRRYASTVLRRKVAKPKPWKRIPPETKQGIKQSALQSFMNDTDKTVRNTMAHLVAAIAKHELPKGQWPELMALLNQSIMNGSVADREIGLFALSVISKRMGHLLKPQFKGLLTMLSKTLTDTSSSDIPYHTIVTLTSMVPSIGTEEMGMFQAMIPPIMMVIKNFANSHDEEKACEAMEIFDDLLESEVAVIVPHIKPLIGLCLELIASENIANELRIKSLNTLRFLIQLKKKTILKHKLVQSILDIIFPLVCKPSLHEYDEENDDDELSLPTVAAQTLDVMALHLPPEKLIPPLMRFFEPALKSADPHHKKAAYLGLAVIAEGCSEYIRYKYLPAYVEVICEGMKEENPVVRNAALYSLGQYAEFLQPEISKYAPKFLPILFEYLNHTFVLLQQGDVKSPSLRKTFYALETFCENLEDGLLPFLPSLMNCLMTFLTINSQKSNFVRELAIRAIGSVASAAKEDFATYFNGVMEKLKIFISVMPNNEEITPKQAEDNRSLQIQSIDALAIIAKSVGAMTFMPVAHDYMKLGLHLIETVDDPCLRRAVYNLFGSISTVLKSDMSLYLPTIVDRMILSIQCSEGLQPKYVDSAPTFRLFDDEDYYDDNDEDDMEDESNLDENDDNSGDIEGYSLEHDFIDEKESACYALKEISAETGHSFIQHIGECFNEILKIIDNISSDVRKAAVFALGQFCISYSDAFIETNSLEHLTSLELKLGIFFPRLFALTREDTERQVALACLETLENILTKIKEKALYANTLDSVMSLVKDVYHHKLSCQDETEDDSEDEEAEYDSILMEYAGDITAALVKIVPTQQMTPLLSEVLPFLFNKAKLQNKTSEKSFSIGTLADIVSSMEKGACKDIFPQLQMSFLNGMRDENEEVRSNAVYGLGVLIENAGEMCLTNYPLFLHTMSTMLAAEENPRAKDNLCAAIARLMMNSISGVPMNEVFPAFLKCLPLQEDLDENDTVYECLSHLHSIRCEQLFQSLPQVLTILSQVLASQKINEKTQAIISDLVRKVYLEFPNDFAAVQKTLPPANAEALVKVL